VAITRRGLTLEEFLKLPEEKPALEYCVGTVRQKVSPEAQHSVLQGLLFQWINGYTWPRKLAVALIELRTTFGGHSHVPDVAVCLWGRIPRDARGRPWGPLREPPLIAIEIASPGQSRRQLREDCEWYVANGVGLALLIDPEDEAILVYWPTAAPQTLIPLANSGGSRGGAWARRVAQWRSLRPAHGAEAASGDRHVAAPPAVGPRP
jgi:Uma2 family endonuclease